MGGWRENRNFCFNKSILFLFVEVLRRVNVVWGVQKQLQRGIKRERSFPG